MLVRCADDGRVVVIDFGLSRWLEVAPSAPQGELESVRGGTEGYVAPEKAAETTPASLKTPAERLSHARAPMFTLGLLGLGFLFVEAWSGRFALSLDMVNLIVLFLALLLHRNAASLHCGYAAGRIALLAKGATGVGLSVLRGSA